MRVPAIGDWLKERDGTDGFTDPGIVVDLLPSGEQVVLGRRYPDGKYLETVHEVTKLIGPMNGRKILR